MHTGITSAVTRLLLLFMLMHRFVQCSTCRLFEGFASPVKLHYKQENETMDALFHPIPTLTC